jgi:hypothetical protein
MRSSESAGGESAGIAIAKETHQIEALANMQSAKIARNR